jgi:predicted enzyme related to lactoylglutathione lyase
LPEEAGPGMTGGAKIMRNRLKFKNLTENGIGLLFLCLSLSLLFLFSSFGFCGPRPEISEQVVFLYYADFEKAAFFYESIMRFKEIEQTSSLDWVAIYRTADHSFVGIVEEGKGFLKPSPDMSVMLSWVTDDVEGWYQYLLEKDVEIVSPPEYSQETGIRGLIFKDPGGYTLELFQWIIR